VYYARYNFRAVLVFMMFGYVFNLVQYRANDQGDDLLPQQEGAISLLTCGLPLCGQRHFTNQLVGRRCHPCQVTVLFQNDEGVADNEDENPSSCESCPDRNWQGKAPGRSGKIGAWPR